MKTMPDHLDLQLTTFWFDLEVYLNTSASHETFRVYVGQGSSSHPKKAYLHLEANLAPFYVELHSGDHRRNMGATLRQVVELARRKGTAETDHPALTSLARHVFAWAQKKRGTTKDTDWLGIGA